MSDFAAKLILLLAVGLFCGCSSSRTKAKNDLRSKCAEELQTVLGKDVLELAEPNKNVDYSELRRGGVTMRLPAFQKAPKLVDDGLHAYLDYAEFFVEVYVADKVDELAAFPKEWGSSDFERFAAIYSISEDKLAAASSKQDLTLVATGLATKSMLVGANAKQRFAAFHSPHLKGFVSGSVSAGSKQVKFECFSSEGRDVPRLVFTFARFSPNVRDIDLERFVAAVQPEY